MEPAFVTQMDFKINEDSGKLDEAIMKMNIKVDSNTVNTDAIINIQSVINVDGTDYKNPIYVDDKSLQCIIPTVDTEGQFSILNLDKSVHEGNFPFRGKYFDLVRYLNKQDPELTYTFYGYSVCHPNTDQYKQILHMLNLWSNPNLDNLINTLEDLKKKTIPISLTLYEFNVIKTWNEIIPLYNSIQGSAANYIHRNPIQKEYLLDMVQKIQKLHRMGIVHCRLTPDNIVLLKDGTTRIVNFEYSKLNGKATINDEIACAPQDLPKSDIIQWYIDLSSGSNSIRSKSPRKKNPKKKTGKRKKR